MLEPPVAGAAAGVDDWLEDALLLVLDELLALELELAGVEVLPPPLRKSVTYQPEPLS